MRIFGRSLSQRIIAASLVALGRACLAGLLLAVFGGIIALAVGWRPATWLLAMEGIGRLGLAATGGALGFALGEFVASSRARVRAENHNTIERVKQQDL